MYGVYARERVQRMVTIDGKDIPEFVNLGHVRNGRVLQLRGAEPGAARHRAAEVDNFERETQQVYLETEFGRPPHRVFSGDPVLIEKLRALKRGDVVNVSGVQFKDGRIRIEKFDVVSTAASTVAASAPATN